MIDELKKSKVDHMSAIINRRHVIIRSRSSSINITLIDKKQISITIAIINVYIETFNSIFFNLVTSIRIMFTIISNVKITTNIQINLITINSITINLVTIKINKTFKINSQTHSSFRFC